MSTGSADLSIVIPALHEAENLTVLLPKLRRVLEELGIRYQLLVVTDPDVSETIAAA